jgi:hypothetical protein
VATFTIKQLVTASGYPERSIRHYVQLGIVPRPPYHGKDTLYADAQLTALRAITKLRDEHRIFRIAPLVAWFEGKSPDAIEAFVNGVAFPPPAPSALPPPAPPPPPAPTTPSPPNPLATGKRWIHVPLVAGMVLLVPDGAPEIALRLADEIRAKYALDAP